MDRNKFVLHTFCSLVQWKAKTVSLFVHTNIRTALAATRIMSSDSVISVHFFRVSVSFSFCFSFDFGEWMHRRKPLTEHNRTARNYRKRIDFSASENPNERNSKKYFVVLLSSWSWSWYYKNASCDLPLAIGCRLPVHNPYTRRLRMRMRNNNVGYTNISQNTRRCTTTSHV